MTLALWGLIGAGLLALAPVAPASANSAGTCPGGFSAVVAGTRDCLGPGDAFGEFDGAPEMVVVAGDPASGGGFFAAARHEVTFDQWDACFADGGCPTSRPSDHGFNRDTRPVVKLTAGDVDTYLAWLSAASGAPYRLLTEAEWEYAAGTGNRHGLARLGGTVWTWVGACRPPAGGMAREDGKCLRRVKRGGAGLQARHDVDAPIAYAYAGLRVARSPAP